MGISIDEAFLDVAGLRRIAGPAARRLVATRGLTLVGSAVANLDGGDLDAAMDAVRSRFGSSALLCSLLGRQQVPAMPCSRTDLT